MSLLVSGSRPKNGSQVCSDPVVESLKNNAKYKLYTAEITKRSGSTIAFVTPQYFGTNVSVS